MLTMRLKAGLAVIAAFALATCGKPPAQQVAGEVSAMMRDFKPPAKAALQPTLAPLLRDLATDNPALAARLPGIAAEERRLLAELNRRVDELDKGAASDGAAASGGGAAPGAQAAFPPRPASSGGGLLGWLVPPAHAQVLDSIGAGYAGGISAFTLTHIVGSVAEAVAKSPDPTRELSKLVGKNGEKVELKADVAKDGSVTSTLDSNVEVAVLGINANSRASVTTKSLCPDAEGRVDLTVRLRMDGSTGRATTTGERYEAQVMIVVDETAEVASMEMKMKYDVAKSGAQGGLRTSGHLTFVSDDFRTFTPGDFSGDTSGDDDLTATMDAMKKVAGLGIGAAAAAKSHWQGGKCIKIEARSPGTVKPSTVSQIDVKTTHRHEGSEIRAGVKVTLEGGASVDPAGFGSPGTFAHTAVAEENKRMKLRLRATSRRGAAEETLIVTTTARGYAINGGGGEFRGSGTVCDLTQPFTVTGNANIKVIFTPNDANGGTYSYTGSIAGASLFGQGTYQVHYVNGEPFKITAGGPGSARGRGGTFTRSGAEAYTLTPKEC